MFVFSFEREQGGATSTTASNSQSGAEATLDPEHAARLAVLLYHVHDCPGDHSSPRLAEVLSGQMYSFIKNILATQDALRFSGRISWGVLHSPSLYLCICMSFFNEDSRAILRQPLR